MYGNLLVTPTILDSYEFAVNAPPSWKVRAEEGFLAKLRREHVDYPAWVKKGQDFEDTVVRVCYVHYKSTVQREPLTQGSELFREVCGRCIGGNFQEKLSKKFKVAGEDAFFFGFADVTFPTITLDIKTTLNYKGPAKYLNGHQHLIYSWIREVLDFEYIIVQWESETANTIQAVHYTGYTAPSMEHLETKIVEKVTSFFDYLKANNLWLDYYQTFSKN